MKFIISKEIFDKVDDMFVGVVVAKGIDNSKKYPKISKMLDESIKIAEKNFLDKKVKEDPLIIPYRDAFLALGINPNKYQCSVEAMFTRISKGKQLPHINPLVDLNNAISLKYTLPMGTHDLSRSELDTELRYAKEGDIFIPMGSEEVENVDLNELVYVTGHDVRTRRWTWRQSNEGKIDDKTNYVFFPIDGFKGFNDDKVLDAIEELKTVLKDEFNCEIVSGYVDKDNNSFEWDMN
jgi:DNA/RNA-binding domain of Phe-tRNA-synthetase-like protein